MSRDVIADFFTSVRNGIAVGKRIVDVPHSVFKEKIAAVLKEEGYLKDYQVILVDKIKKNLRVLPRYIDGRAAITAIKSVSTAGGRCYSAGKDIRPYKNGLGVTIVSTSYGVMSDVKSKKFVLKDGKTVALGGEILCKIW